MLSDMFTDLMASGRDWTRLLRGGLLVGYRKTERGRVLQIGRKVPSHPSPTEITIVLRDFGKAIDGELILKREESQLGSRVFRGDYYNVAFYPFEVAEQGSLFDV